MPSHNKILALAAVPLAACAFAVHAADNNKVTIENRMAQCQGCHGIPNWKTAFPELYRVPKLGGQKANYIAAALKEYKSGDRDFATMRAIAADLSDADIEQLARYNGSDTALEAAAPLPASAPANTAAAAPATAPTATAATPAAPGAVPAGTASAPATSASTTPASGAPSTAASPAPATGAMPAASASGNSSTAASTSKGGKK
jgi:cytochrome c553